MGALDKAQAYKLTNNEFIAIASSFAMGIDYTDIFDMWGVAISREARNQIYALELEPAERVFFDITGNNHKKGELSDGINDVRRIIIGNRTKIDGGSTDEASEKPGPSITFDDGLDDTVDETAGVNGGTKF